MGIAEGGKTDGWIFFIDEVINMNSRAHVSVTSQVHDGARVSQDLANYWDRVLTHSMNIEIRNVNITDEGHYTLKDRSSRVVSVTRMDLTGGSHTGMYAILYKRILSCC